MAPSLTITCYFVHKRCWSYFILILISDFRSGTLATASHKGSSKGEDERKEKRGSVRGKSTDMDWWLQSGWKGKGAEKQGSGTVRQSHNPSMQEMETVWHWVPGQSGLHSRSVDLDYTMRCCQRWEERGEKEGERGGQRMKNPIGHCQQCFDVPVFKQR